jgi:hypothetical protein
MSRVDRKHYVPSQERSMAYQDSPQCVRPGATMESGPELIRFMRKAHRPWRDDLRASHVRPPLPPFVSAAAQPNSAAAFLDCWQPQDLLQNTIH